MAIDVSKLQVTVAEGARWRRTLNITIPRDLVQAERKAAAKALSSRVRLPGFRQGKIPAAVLEKRFGPALDQELLDRVIGEAYRGVVQERALRPISEGEVGQVSYRAETDLSFEVSFDIAPEVDISRLGGFRVERPAIRVTDEEVESVLRRLREREGSWAPLENGKPAQGEMVAVRIEQLEDADAPPRKYEFTLGAGEAVPEVERAIQSLDVGASGEFTIEFPEPHTAEEHAKPGHTHGTVPRRLRIHLDGRKRLDLPELTDEFAKKVGEFESVEELRRRIREELFAEAEREAEARVREALVDEILSANSFEIPGSMVDRFIRSAIGDPKDLSEENWAEAKKHLGPSAERGVKRHLVVTRVAEANKLTATEKDLDARIEQIAGKNSLSPSEVYSGLQRAGRLERLEHEITEEKVFEFLKGQSEIA